MISTTPQGEEINFSYADYRDLADQSRSLKGILAYSRRGKFLRIGAESQLVLDDVVSPNYFSVLGINAQLGQIFPAESQPSSEPGAVISDSFWHRVFNKDPSIVGKQIWLNGRAYKVLAVAPMGFRGLQRGVPTDLWIPAATEYSIDELAARNSREFELIGRLRPGATAEEAKVELNTLAHSLALAYPAIDKARSVSLISESERFREALAPALILMTAVGLVLLICCANVAGLVLARSDARRKEVAMRLALGSGRVRLMRQLLTESLLLASLGAAIGLILAAGILRLEPALMPPSAVEVGLELHLDASILAFTALTTLLAVLVFGMAQRISIPGVELPQGQLTVPVKFNAVDGNYFRTIGTRLIEARLQF